MVLIINTRTQKLSFLRRLEGSLGGNKFFKMLLYSVIDEKQVAYHKLIEHVANDVTQLISYS